MKKFIKSFVKGFINIFICKVLYRVHYFGLENLKGINKCLICPNHSNTVEPAWIYAKTENLCIMAKAELFEKKFWNKIFTYFDVFPIRRGEHDVKSLIHAINLFKNVEKRKLLIFPEGERLPKEVNRVKAKVGPIYIAYKAKVPIIPVYITKNAKLFSRVDIIFGKPITLPDDLGKDKEKIQRLADDLMDYIYDLKK
jgi:1-acyl-sn-glycerol-3-phosphate acyltransferase